MLWLTSPELRGLSVRRDLNKEITIWSSFSRSLEGECFKLRSVYFVNQNQIPQKNAEAYKNTSDPSS